MGRRASYFRLKFFAGLLAAGLGLLTLGAIAQTAEPAGRPAGAGDGAANGGAEAARREGVILTLDGPVTPASAAYLAREIDAASEAKKELVILEIDTPGGLVDSMKTIIKSILASETPVATFVYPQGARSASAGFYIMYAAHVSAMAPATNTGSATPVELGGPPSEESPFEDAPKPDGEAPSTEEKPADNAPSNGAEAVEKIGEAAREIRPTSAPEKEPLSNEGAMRAKIINDSAAYIRALAGERGRNADWAERAVREGISASAREALDLKVIDLVAEDIDDLLKQIDGRTVEVASGPKTIATAGIVLEKRDPTLLEKILAFISHPNVAVILMSLGTTGIIIEMWNPGSVLPGIIGLGCLILGLYALQVLPFNWLGLALMTAGALFIAVEAYTPTLGLVGLAGAIMFGFGLFVIFPEGFEVSRAVIGAILAIFGGFLALVLFAVVGSRNHGPLIGAEAIKRREGVVDDWDGREGWVIVDGERWRARSDRPLKKGERIKVVEMDGLVLIVKHAKAHGLLAGILPSEA
jgi:membrane-bound serine protease (ClpP class)